jgi:hypothetical protein
MYELHYSGTNSEFKIWVDSKTRAEITLIDGIRTHPWLDPRVLKENFVNKSLSGEEIHEFGDSWYNFTAPGMAFLFIKATDYNAKVSFSFGYKPLFPMWVIYVAGGVGGGVVIACLFICCCVVRRSAAKRAEEANSKVKKYQNGDVSTEDKLSRFKYGRQSIPLALPELADNGDDINKPQDDAYGGGDYSHYKGGEEDPLDFHQLEDSTQYNNNNHYA